MASSAVDPATGGAVMTFLVPIFFPSGVLEMGLGEGPAVGPVSAFDGKVGRGGRGGGLAAFQATASEMLDGLVPAAFFTTREPSLGVLPLPFLLFFPMVREEKMEGEVMLKRMSIGGLRWAKILAILKGTENVQISL
jgi:hypothetical protein